MSFLPAPARGGESDAPETYQEYDQKEVAAQGQTAVTQQAQGSNDPDPTTSCDPDPTAANDPNQPSTVPDISVAGMPDVGSIDTTESPIVSDTEAPLDPATSNIDRDSQTTGSAGTAAVSTGPAAFSCDPSSGDNTSSENHPVQQRPTTPAAGAAESLMYNFSETDGLVDDFEIVFNA
jgi:hypothetical protein